MQLGPLGEQLGELVDDHDQRGKRRQLGQGAARGGVIGDAHQVARRTQDLLAAHDLARQRIGHPVDQRELVGQVRDHGRDVRHAGEAEERGAALEVDEHEVQRLGRVGGGQTEHEGAQDSSLLPDPVAPMQSPCGPLPPSADSFRSRTTAAPRSSTPIGTRNRSAAARRHRVRSASIPAGPGRSPNRPGSPGAARAAASSETPAGR